MPKDRLLDDAPDPFPDPEPPDEEDPSFKEEMFRSFMELGWKPEDLTREPETAAEYSRWLKRQGEEGPNE
jgi:hypothetical protein